ncbi:MULTISPECIES: hypothetical protein [Bacteria]|uniref:hypothetical protein n=1 Tax=Bacteria TaxID=2 RepID=UPI001056E3DC|nr:MULTISPECIES: hypothetical protein [Bacteria]
MKATIPLAAYTNDRFDCKCAESARVAFHQYRRSAALPPAAERTAASGDRPPESAPAANTEIFMANMTAGNIGRLDLSCRAAQSTISVSELSRA